MTESTRYEKIYLRCKNCGFPHTDLKIKNSDNDFICPVCASEDYRISMRKDIFLNEQQGSITSPFQLLISFALIFAFGIVAYFLNPSSWKAMSIPGWIKWMVAIWALSGTALYVYDMRSLVKHDLNVETMEETEARLKKKEYVLLWVSYIFNWPLFLIAGHLTEGEPMLIFPKEEEE